MKRIQLEPWTPYDKLSLVSAVMRTGDQNWNAVARATRNIFEESTKYMIEEKRPPEWFSNKQCAAQYEALLKNIGPRRKKKSEKAVSEHVGESVTEIIMNTVRQECIEELKRFLAATQAEYLKACKEVEDLEAGRLDHKLVEMIEEYEAKEREKEIKMKLKFKLGEKNPEIIENSVNINSKPDDNEIKKALDKEPPVSEPAKTNLTTSPLLTSLLQSPSPLTRPSLPSNTSPTISLLLNSSPSVPSSESPTLTKLLETSSAVIGSPLATANPSVTFPPKQESTVCSTSITTTPTPTLVSPHSSSAISTPSSSATTESNVASSYHAPTQEATTTALITPPSAASTSISPPAITSPIPITSATGSAADAAITNQAVISTPPSTTDQDLVSEEVVIKTENNEGKEVSEENRNLLEVEEVANPTTPEIVLEDLVHTVVESEVVIHQETPNSKKITHPRKINLEQTQEADDDVLETVEEIIEKVEEAIIETVGEETAEIVDIALNQSSETDNLSDQIETLELDSDAVELIVLGHNQGKGEIENIVEEEVSTSEEKIQEVVVEEEDIKLREEIVEHEEVIEDKEMEETIERNEEHSLTDNVEINEGTLNNAKEEEVLQDDTSNIESLANQEKPASIEPSLDKEITPASDVDFNADNNDRNIGINNQGVESRLDEISNIENVEVATKLDEAIVEEAPEEIVIAELIEEVVQAERSEVDHQKHNIKETLGNQEMEDIETKQEAIDENESPSAADSNNEASIKSNDTVSLKNENASDLELKENEESEETTQIKPTEHKKDNKQDSVAEKKDSVRKPVESEDKQQLSASEPPTKRIKTENVIEQGIKLENKPVQEVEKRRTGRKRHHPLAGFADSKPNSPAPSSHSMEDEREYKAWKKSIMLVYNRLAAHKYASVFLKPITEAEATGYHKVVLRPMDLTTIKRNIETGVIRSTVEFQRDMILMAQNAMIYNKADSLVFKMAEDMLADMMSQMEVMVQALGDGVPLWGDSDEKLLTRGRASKVQFDESSGQKRRSQTDDTPIRRRHHIEDSAKKRKIQYEETPVNKKKVSYSEESVKRKSSDETSIKKRVQLEETNIKKKGDESASKKKLTIDDSSSNSKKKAQADDNIVRKKSLPEDSISKKTSDDNPSSGKRKSQQSDDSVSKRKNETPSSNKKKTQPDETLHQKRKSASADDTSVNKKKGNTDDTPVNKRKRSSVAASDEPRSTNKRKKTDAT